MDQRQILSHLKLHLEAQYTDIQDCWKEGYEAAQANPQEERNPYPEDSIEFKTYEEGWWTAFYEEESLFAKKPVSSVVTQPTARTSHLAKIKTWFEWASYRLLGLGAATMMAILGYQLADFAFV